MAILRQATLTPSKLELFSSYAERVGLTDSPAADLKQLGACRFDDPAGEVGIESHLLGTPDGETLHIPDTYRNDPLEGADGALIGTMQHSVLGKRWVYDACHDPVYVTELVRAILTGGTEVEEFVETAEGPVSRPSSASVQGSGSPNAALPAIDAVTAKRAGTVTMIDAGTVQIAVHHAPVATDTGNTLMATWPDGSGVLAAIH
jgi:hypothetical protein